MKKFLSLLVAPLTLVSLLSAQTIGIPDQPSVIIPPMIDNSIVPPSTTSVVSYPIGTITQPVTAGEYCTFLTDTLAPQSEPSLDSLKQKFGIIENGPLTCDGFFNNDSSLNNYNFYWDLNRTHEIIATVPSLEVQQLFNNWRGNPYSQELLDYILDTYYTDPASMGSKTGKNKQYVCYAPSNILQMYPNSTTLAKAKNLALFPVAGQYLFFNERRVSVSLNPNAPINPRNFISTNRYQLPQSDYHRPILIAPKI